MSFLSFLLKLVKIFRSLVFFSFLVKTRRSSVNLYLFCSVVLQDTEKENVHFPMRFQLKQHIFFRLIVFFQVLVGGSFSILVHLCEQNGRIRFSSITLNFLIEFFKLILSICSLIYSKEFQHKQIHLFPLLKQSSFYSIPALLYFVNNNLAVHIQIQMDPTSYQILSNLKIFTTTILYRLIIKQKLIKQQYVGLVLLFLSGLVYSYGSINNSNTEQHDTYIHPLGIPMILVYCTISGLAGVYNEWILKRYYSESIHLQNIFLYFYGTIFNFLPIFYLSVHVNLFDGFSVYTWLIIFTQVFNGLFMSIVMKYSSNLIRLFIISFSLIVTTFLSHLVFEISFNIFFFISFFIMLCALSLFHVNFSK